MLVGKIFEADRNRENIFRAKICIGVKIRERARRRADIILGVISLKSMKQTDRE